ncbi:MAG: transketolase, partial [Rhodospirillaceae bacterium]|nr:transketolase [Rhodospirillaceae bacterium]
EHRAENACARGAYVLAEAGAERQATLLASGSEVSIAVEAQALLKAEGIEAAVVSMPCWELFERQPDDYRASVLGDAPRIACEAASGFGWTRWTGDGGGFVGMKSFGASAPAPHLYEHFGVTAAAVADAARTIIAGRG